MTYRGGMSDTKKCPECETGIAANEWTKHQDWHKAEVKKAEREALAKKQQQALGGF